MLKLFRLWTCILLTLFSLNAAADENMIVAVWPSAVTTLIVHTDGSGTFICNGTSGKVCSIAILDDACTAIAKSKAPHASSCHPERLSHYQMGLGHKIEVKTAPAQFQYCATAADAVVLRGCLVNVQWIDTPYTEKPKVSVYFHVQ